MHFIEGIEYFSQSISNLLNGFLIFSSVDFIMKQTSYNKQKIINLSKFTSKQKQPKM